MRDRVAVDLLAGLADALVHVGHELVEMAALLRREADAGEEQVHEHGLPAADVAVDVEAARRRLAGALEEREQPAASRPPIVQLPRQRVEPRRHIELRGVGLELVGGDLRAQAFDGQLRHRSHGPSTRAIASNAGKAQSRDGMSPT